MHLIGRRNLLTGLGLGAGSHLLGAMCKSMLPEAMGAAALAKLLVLITSCNGFLERFWTCPARSETDFDLTPTLMPLAPYKQNLVIASKFYNPFSHANHGNQMATLTVTESPVQESQMRGPPGGISLDRLIATKIGANDAFDSTAVGCITFRKGGSYDQALCMSADGPRKPFPAIGAPMLAYKTWFGGPLANTMPGMPSGMQPAPSGDTLEAALNANHGFLDLINEDVRRLQGRLAAPERAKLDQYLGSVQSVQKSLGLRSTARLDCKSVKAPAIDPMKGALDETLDPDVLAAHIDVSFAAL